MKEFTHLDLFSGIGGFSYAARTVWGEQYRNIGFCEIDPFCQAVLAKNFPDCQVFSDIRTLANNPSKGLEGSDRQEPSYAWDSGRVDLITGGFPCQPFSAAGRRKGTDDDRYLWPTMFEVIRCFRPSWIIAENVYGLTTWNEGLVLEQVCSDLESEGYETEPFIIPAVAVNAPHRRDRIWIVANRSSQRRQQESRSTLSNEGKNEGRTTQDDHKSSGHNQSPIADSRSQRRNEGTSEAVRPKGIQPVQPYLNDFSWNTDWKEIAFATCHDRMDDGFSKGMVRLPNGNAISPARWRKEALKAYGNAIVPAVAMEIMKAIKEVYGKGN